MISKIVDYVKELRRGQILRHVGSGGKMLLATM